MAPSLALLHDPAFADMLDLPRAFDERTRRDELVPARPAPAGWAVELRAASKVFGHRVVLDRLSLTITPGQFVAVVGRSGGGKTTLLRLIAGLEQADHGAVVVDGVLVDGPQASARLMFQDARLLPWQSVLANVGIARGPLWRERAQAVLQEVGLGDRAGEWPRLHQ